MITKEQTIEDIISDYDGQYSAICRNPEYNLPDGLPQINLQVSTGKSTDLYLIIDVNTSDTLRADIRDGARALVQAMAMARNNGKVRGYLLCINPPDNAVKNLRDYCVRQLIRALELPQPEPPRNKPFYSIAEYSGRRMGQVGLN
jgi:hypothetical protein